MNLETTKPGSSVTLHPPNFPTSAFLAKHASWTPGFLIITSILCLASRVVAGDAVAVGYNADSVWTAVTYYTSSTPKGGKDYKTENEAREEALRDVRRRSDYKPASAHILASSDSTGFVAVARGTVPRYGEVTLVRRGRSQSEADAKAMAELKKDGATANQKIVYRYFSHGADSK